MNRFWKVTGIVLVALLLVGGGFAAGFFLSRKMGQQVIAARPHQVERADKPNVEGIAPLRPDTKEQGRESQDKDRPNTVIRARAFAQGGRGHVALALIKTLGGLALLTAYTALVAWLVVRNTRPAAAASLESPLDTLKRRYAAGEVDDKQFKAIKAQIEGK